MRQLTVDDLVGHKLPIPKGTIVIPQCSQSNTTHSKQDHNPFDACQKLVTTEVDSASGVSVGSADLVDPSCVEEAMIATAIGSSGASSTALLHAFEAAATSLNIINSTHCDMTKLHDDIDKAAHNVNVLIAASAAYLVFATFAGLPFIIDLIRQLYTEAKILYGADSEGTKSEKVIVGYFQLGGLILALGAIIYIFIELGKFSDTLEQEAVLDAKGCGQYVTADLSDHEAALTGVFSAAVACYGLAILCFLGDKAMKGDN